MSRQQMMMSEARAIAAAYKDGDAIADIAARFKRSRTTVDNIARRFNLRRRNKRHAAQIPPGTEIDYGNPNRPKHEATF